MTVALSDRYFQITGNTKKVCFVIRDNTVLHNNICCRTNHIRGPRVEDPSCNL